MWYAHSRGVDGQPDYQVQPYKFKICELEMVLVMERLEDAVNGNGVQEAKG